jgi:hypothetical protein
MRANHNVSRESAPDFTTEPTEITETDRKEKRKGSDPDPEPLTFGLCTTNVELLREPRRFFLRTEPPPAAALMPLFPLRSQRPAADGMNQLPPFGCGRKAPMRHPWPLT